MEGTRTSFPRTVIRLLTFNLVFLIYCKYLLRKLVFHFSRETESARRRSWQGVEMNVCCTIQSISGGSASSGECALSFKKL